MGGSKSKLNVCNENAQHTLKVQYCGGWGYAKHVQRLHRELEKKTPGKYSIDAMKDKRTTGRFEVTLYKNSKTSEGTG